VQLSEARRPADRSVALVDLTIGRLLAQRAAEYPERTALVGVAHGSAQPRRLTYAELLTEATRVAAGLSTLAPADSAIALWAPNVVEWPIVQYGAALAGLTLVAINPVLRDDELEYAVRHSGAALLLHADVSRDYPMGEVAERVGARLPGVHRISLSEIGSWPSPPASLTGPDDPDRIAMLQYTSGTTGRPKAVALRHRSLVNVAKLTMQAVGVAEGAVCLNPLPMFHTAGCVIGTLGPLWLGGTAVLVERFEPAPVLEQLRAERAEVLFYVPTVLAALLDCQRLSTDDAPRLKVVMGGAAEVAPALIDGAAAVFGATVINLFGQTELSPVLSATRPDDSRADLLGTVGRPLPQVDCKVVDPTTGRVCGIGEPGEICARGYQQFVEYLHDPQATAAALDGEGFVRTGDLGSMDERGYLTITGRLKELIIRGGENIAPADVERVLIAHPAVNDVSVVGVPDDRLGEIVAAVVCADGSVEHLKESLAEFARERLAPFKIPARWFVADGLPTTPTGKVRRFELREAIRNAELDEL